VVRATPTPLRGGSRSPSGGGDLLHVEQISAVWKGLGDPLEFTQRLSHGRLYRGHRLEDLRDGITVPLRQRKLV
jgi:hypothetical protein